MLGEDKVMDARKAETLYLSGRVSDSLAMAAAAAGPCAQIAHLALARLYGEAIDALVVRPGIPTSPSRSAAEAGVDGAGKPRPMFVALSASDRQRASSLLA